MIREAFMEFLNDLKIIVPCGLAASALFFAIVYGFDIKFIKDWLEQED